MSPQRRLSRPSLESVRTSSFLIAWLTATGALLASMGQQLILTGPPPPFEAILAGPAIPVSGWLATFLECAATFALVLQAVLTYDRRARRVAAGGALLGLYTVLDSALSSSSLRLNTPAYTSIRIACNALMLYLIVAEAANGGLWWAAADLAMLIPIVIVLTYTNAAFAAGDEFRIVLATSTNGLLAVFIVYYTLSGLLRAGALHSAQQENAHSARERWWYRSLILVYLLGWYSIFGYSAMVHNLNEFSATLYTNIVFNSLLSSFTVMTLSFFLMHTRATRDALERRVAVAEKAHANDEGALRGRRQYLGYIFHEARVPFSALVLGLDSLAADSRTPIDLLEDISLMRSSAADMQRVLNDTLDVEKMGSGMYAVVGRPTHLPRLLARARRTMLPLAHRQRVRVDVSVDDAVPLVAIVDPDRLLQVIDNLLSNAIKFSPHDGTGCVQVRLSTISAPTLQCSSDVDAPRPRSSPQSVTAGVLEDGGACLDRALGRMNTAVRSLVARAVNACVPRTWSVGRGNPPTAPTVTAAQDDMRAVPQQLPLLPPLPRPLNTGTSPESDQQLPLQGAAAAAAAATTAPTGAQQCGVLVLEVADNGEGISEAARRKLFHMFSQMAEGQLQVAKGSGLGLYICQQIVTRMGGAIGVESHKTAPAVVLVGSVFRVEVPISSPDSCVDDAGGSPEDDTHGVPTTDEIIEQRVASFARSAAAEHAAAARDGDMEGDAGPDETSVVVGMGSAQAPAAVAAAAAAAPQHIAAPPSRVPARQLASPLPPNTSILVVDDDTASRVFMARRLSRVNPQCVVHVAENGIAALHAMEQQHFDVVCIDKQMPLMDGPTAVSAMRARGYRGVIVGVTGSLLEEEIAEFLASGAAAVVEKPVNLPALLCKVRDLLALAADGSRNHEATTASGSASPPVSVTMHQQGNHERGSSI